MIFESQKIVGLTLIRQDPFEDVRGRFRRHFCAREYSNAGLNPDISQTNISENRLRHTLRGFHYQTGPHAEDKTLSVLSGAVFNVVIDLRKESTSFLSVETFELSATEDLSLYVPAGCANAFLTLQDATSVLYYMSTFYSPDNAGAIRYNDPYFQIPWPHEPAVISEKDLHIQDFDPEDL